jgi:hypothetical protein
MSKDINTDWEDDVWSGPSWMRVNVSRMIRVRNNLGGIKDE